VAAVPKCSSWAATHLSKADVKKDGRAASDRQGNARLMRPSHMAIYTVTVTKKLRLASGPW
jgi:hypothetical protein